MLEMEATAEFGNGPSAAPTKLRVRLGEGRGTPAWTDATVQIADHLALALLGPKALVSAGQRGERSYIPADSAEWRPVVPSGPTPR